MNWWLRLMTWDGILPAFVLAVPLVGRALVPQNDLFDVATAVLLPIVALCVRFRVGCRMIETNGCRPWFRDLQRGFLTVGLLSLMLVDCLLLILSLNNAGLNDTDRNGLVVCFVIYFLLMVVATYPGRTSRNHLEADFEPASSPPSPT